MSYETNTLASISGLLCLSEIAGSGEGPDPSSPVGGTVPCRSNEPSRSRAYPLPAPTPQADQRALAPEKP